MHVVRLLETQFMYENRIFWRSAVGAFFTIAMPLFLLVLLSIMLGKEQLEIGSEVFPFAQFYVPAMSAMAVVGACFTNVAMTVAIHRDSGLLKRYRGTPLPTWVFVFGKLSHAVLIGLLMVAAIVGVGILFLDVSIAAARMDVLLITLALGAATFCTLGLVMSAVVPNAEAAPAIVQAVVLPLLFISDVFMPMYDAPQWLQNIATVFPIRHFSLALQGAFNGEIAMQGGLGMHLGVLVIWFVVSLPIAIRFFRWEPKR